MKKEDLLIIRITKQFLCGDYSYAVNTNFYPNYTQEVGAHWHGLNPPPENTQEWFRHFNDVVNAMHSCFEPIKDKPELNVINYKVIFSDEYSISGHALLRDRNRLSEEELKGQGSGQGIIVSMPMNQLDIEFVYKALTMVRY